MCLELHDFVEGDSLVSKIENINDVQQAEVWIGETKDDPNIIRWEFKDSQTGTIISKWERPQGSIKYPKRVA